MCGHALDLLPEIPDGVIHCVVTSPPYWNLRDYKAPAVVWSGEPGCEHEWGAEIIPKGKSNWDTFADYRTDGGAGKRSLGIKNINQGQFCGRCGAWRGQLGLEPTPGLYCQHIVEVCREVKRVLRDDGTFWLNLGDSYASNPGDRRKVGGFQANPSPARAEAESAMAILKRGPGIKPKDLVGIPWTVAFALRDDGWYLRRDVIWEKPNPMPESCRDRPTSAHEYVFQLTKSPRYFYDQDAVREPHKAESLERVKNRFYTADQVPGRKVNSRPNGDMSEFCHPAGRNLRSVWNKPTKPYPEAHFATFPPELARRCILTSPTKVCKECGAGWERVVERPKPPFDDTRTPGKHTPTSKTKVPGWKMQEWLNANPPKTLGFRPSCDCDAGVDKAIILDPFMGSGTVALVAHENFRHYVGLEINPDYIPLSDKRGLRQEVIF